MTRHLMLSATLLFFANPDYSQPTQPQLKSSDQILYPNLARDARIAGRVQVEYQILPTGKTTAVRLISGHPLLAQAALENLNTWIFTTASLGNDLPPRRVEFIFVLVGESLQGQTSRMTSGGIQQIFVSANPRPAVKESGCASDAKTPPKLPIAPGDFVGLTRSTCFGMCPSYSVRVFGDGRVLWDGKYFVETLSTTEYRIPSSDAKKLIAKFQTNDVWSLCRSYKQLITDMQTIDVELSISGQSKQVSDYAEASPAWFHPMQDEIDRIARTHIPRHGDPLTEPLANIGDEYLDKPGLTPLMRAVSLDDLTSATRLVTSGANVNDVDSSGWAALHYAAWRPRMIELLLKTGANPSIASPYGDTALMTGAIGGIFSPELARQGGNINAQNRDGVTVLMLLAAGGDPNTIKAALDAGANPRLTDTNGRSSLTYLEARYCGKPIVRRMSHLMAIQPPETCNGLEPAAYSQSKALLQAAATR